MDQMLEFQLDFLRAAGFATLEHDSHVPFISHLLGTRRLLHTWSCPEYLATAGLFHSIYGTEYFTHSAEIARPDVRGLIGADAEHVAWLWCTIRRDSIDRQRRTAINRMDDSSISLSEMQLADLATLWAADTVEQLHRMTPAEQEFAHGVDSLADLTPRAAQLALAAVAVPSRSSLSEQ